MLPWTLLVCHTSHLTNLFMFLFPITNVRKNRHQHFPARQAACIHAAEQAVKDINRLPSYILYVHKVLARHVIQELIQSHYKRSRGGKVTDHARSSYS